MMKPLGHCRTTNLTNLMVLLLVEEGPWPLRAMGRRRLLMLMVVRALVQAPVLVLALLARQTS